MIALNLEPPPDWTTYWSARRIARRVGMSITTVQRIWADAGLKPHRTEKFTFSIDPQLEVDDGLGADPAQQLRSRPVRQLGRSTSWLQVAQEVVEPVDHPAALAGQLVAAVGQEPQHHAVVLGTDAAQVGLALGDPCDAGRIDAVVFASVAAGEQTSTGGERRGHVRHGLLGRDESLGQKVPETCRTLDDPDPVGPALCLLELP